MGKDGDNKNWAYISTHTHQVVPVTELGSQKEKKALQGKMKEPSSRRCLSDHNSDNLTPTGVRNPILKPRREAKMVNIDLRARHCPDAITE